MACHSRNAPRVKNPEWQVVMRRAAAARRRLLICQNLVGQLPHLPLPLVHPWIWFADIHLCIQQTKNLQCMETSQQIVTLETAKKVEILQSMHIYIILKLLFRI